MVSTVAAIMIKVNATLIDHWKMYFRPHVSKNLQNQMTHQFQMLSQFSAGDLWVWPRWSSSGRCSYFQHQLMSHSHMIIHDTNNAAASAEINPLIPTWFKISLNYCIFQGRFQVYLGSKLDESRWQLRIWDLPQANFIETACFKGLLIDLVKFLREEHSWCQIWWDHR